MRPVKLLTLFALLAFLPFGSAAKADGPLGRIMGQSGTTTGWVSRSKPTGRGTYPTRNLNQGRSLLPSGRSYYQGRYYGNFNNRFYGPQYGYF